eukprot:15017083-Alexandrium_andersonii.AAC.1
MGARSPSGASSTSFRTSPPSLDCGIPELGFRRPESGLRRSRAFAGRAPELGLRSSRAWSAELLCADCGAPGRDFGTPEFRSRSP